MKTLTSKLVGWVQIDNHDTFVDAIFLWKYTHNLTLYKEKIIQKCD